MCIRDRYTIGDYGFEMPTDEKCSAGESRMMVSVHYYDPWDYCCLLYTSFCSTKSKRLIRT